MSDNNPLGYDGPNKPFENVQVDIAWYKDPKRTHYAGLMFPPRPGVMLFSTLLEYTFFPPSDPSRNKLFNISIFKWEEMVWSVISIPKEFEAHAKACVNKAGLRIADGVPTMLGAGGPKRFTIDVPNLWTLENESNHPVYKHLNAHGALMNVEVQLCDVIMGGDLQRAEEQIKKMGGN